MSSIRNLQGEKEELTGTVESLKAEIAKNDNLFKRTLEADRNKMKQELQTRTSRIRSLGKDICRAVDAELRWILHYVVPQSVGVLFK